MDKHRITMSEQARQRHMALPVGRRRSDRKIIRLDEALADLEQLVSASEQTIAERIEVARARWEAGEWSDVLHGTEGTIDLAKAISALEAQTELGAYLLERTERSIEMSIEANIREGV